MVLPTILLVLVLVLFVVLEVFPDVELLDDVLFPLEVPAAFSVYQEAIHKLLSPDGRIT